MNREVLKQLVEDAMDAACNDPALDVESPTFAAIRELVGFVHETGRDEFVEGIRESAATLSTYEADPTLDDVLEIAATHGYSVTFRLEGGES